ncbi:hypothetical protein DYH09_15210 [bacterium CPR1]|nr:hypothetical protein [bacterium CPR1]
MRPGRVESQVGIIKKLAGDVLTIDQELDLLDVDLLLPHVAISRSHDERSAGGIPRARLEREDDRRNVLGLHSLA